MSSIAAAAQRTLGRALPPWWLLLISSIGWMLVALIVSSSTPSRSGPDATRPPGR